MSESARHSHKSVEWYTPPWLVEKIRAVLGEISLDPCSSVEANDIIRADQFWWGSGLEGSWKTDTILLNPPGKSPSNPKGAAPWWQKLVYHHVRGDFRAAIYVGFSLEQLQTLQSAVGICPLEYTTCVTKKRISFVSTAGDKQSPTHSNFITLLTHDRRYEESFADIFQEVGYIVRR